MILPAPTMKNVRVLKQTAIVLLVTSFRCGAACQSHGSSRVVRAMPASFSLFSSDFVSVMPYSARNVWSNVPFGTVIRHVAAYVNLELQLTTRSVCESV